MVKRLVGSRRVLWVNTIGSRAPALDMATLRRGAEKARGWLSKSPAPSAAEGQPGPAPTVLSPVMWPSYRGVIQRRLNKRLLLRAIHRSLRDLPRPRVAITTLPLSADLVGALDVDAWLYYCVDDLAAWPGLDGATLRSMEDELVRRVDGVITVSEHLQSRIEGMGRPSTLISHGVDLSHWSGPRSTAANERSVLFWGLIDERMETDWVLRLADRLTDGQVCLAGPVVSGEGALGGHPRIRLLGPQPYDALPGLAAAASVLVMPYRDLPATRAMQPLKMKEYLATGLPCVVRRLPATEPWSDCLDTVDGVEPFVEAVLQRLDSGTPTEQSAARRRLDGETWDAKAAAFEGVLAELCGGDLC